MAVKRDVSTGRHTRSKPSNKRVERRMSAAPSSSNRKKSKKSYTDNDTSIEKNNNKKKTNSLASLSFSLFVMILVIMGIITLSENNFNLDMWLRDGDIENISSGNNMLLKQLKSKDDFSTSAESIIGEIEADMINAKKNTYDFNNNLYQGQGKPFKYYKTEDELSKVGIDVSYHQKNIDWKKVKEYGVEYAIIRIGYRGYKTGEIVMDKDFTKNIEGALDAGIRVGVYFFTQAVNVKEAQEEADYILKNIKKYNITYPIVIDTEETPDKKNARSNSSNIDKKTLTDICIAFCDRINEANYPSAIYASRNWFYSQLELERLEKYDKWLANYSDKPDFPFQFTMWQYTSEAKIDGIDGNVDLNMCIKDYGGNK